MSVEVFKVGSLVRVSSDGFLGRIENIDRTSAWLQPYGRWTDVSELEFVQDDKSAISVGDIVQPVGTHKAGQVVEIITKYRVKFPDNAAFEWDQVVHVDKNVCKEFASNRCEHLQNAAAEGQKAALKAQEAVEKAQQKVQETMQELTKFLATMGTMLDAQDFCALANTLVTK